MPVLGYSLRRYKALKKCLICFFCNFAPMQPSTDHCNSNFSLDSVIELDSINLFIPELPY